MTKLSFPAVLLVVITLGLTVVASIWGVWVRVVERAYAAKAVAAGITNIPGSVDMEVITSMGETKYFLYCQEQGWKWDFIFALRPRQPSPFNGDKIRVKTEKGEVVMCVIDVSQGATSRDNPLPWKASKVWMVRARLE